MPHAWTWVTELGNSKWLLPAATLLIAIAWHSRTLPGRTAVHVGLAILSTSMVVLASKIAFMGWGIGSAALDFTGFSGHAAMSACIYPLLFAVLGTGRKAARGLPLAGFALAAFIAWSRLPLQAHSLSEVVGGFLLGAGGSILVLRHWPWHRPPLSAWRWLAAGPSAVVVLILALPSSLSTHGAVIAVAKALSGRHEIHTRDWLHTHSAKPAQERINPLT